MKPFYLLIFVIIRGEICGLKIVPPKIQLDILCTMDERIVKCSRSNSSALKNNNTFVAFETDNTFIFQEEEDGDSVVLAGFSCTAPYPVEWIHTQDQWMSSVTDNWFHLLRHEVLTFKRSFSNKTGRKGHESQFEEYPHTALLRLTNTMSLGGEFAFGVGEYICQSVEAIPPSGSRISSKIRVFQKIENEKLFPLSGKTVTVWEDERDDDGKIVFPCHVLYPDPDMNVTMYKKIVRKVLFPHIPTKRLGFNHLNIQQQTKSNTNSSGTQPTLNNTIESWEAVLPNQDLDFQADLGFVYAKESNHALTPGLYKCVNDESNNESNNGSVTDDDDVANDDYVLINFRNGMKPTSPEEQSPSPPAMLNCSVVDSKRKIYNVQCCSNSSTPPALYLISCFSKDMCEKQRRQLSSSDLGLKGANRLTTSKGNCRTSYNLSYTWPIPLNSRCIGDGVDSLETCIFGMDGNSSYNKWEDVDPEKMLSLTLLGRRARNINATKLQLYEGQNYTFRCTIAVSYFAIGSQFKLNFLNGTSIWIQGKKAIQREDSFTIGISDRIIKIMMGKDIRSISCFAAIIQSQNWVEKSLEFEIQHGEKPTIAKFSGDEIFWTLGERKKQLICEFTGVPPPKAVRWLKDNRTIRTTNSPQPLYNFSMTTSNTSILEIDAANYETHGEYSCLIRNIFGSAKKTTRVYVRASEEIWTIWSSSLGVMCFVIIAALLGYQTWRQRQVLKAHGSGETRNGFARL